MNEFDPLVDRVIQRLLCVGLCITGATNGTVQHVLHIISVRPVYGTGRNVEAS